MRFISSIVPVSVVLVSACSSSGRDAAAGTGAPTAVESIYTDLSGTSCRSEPDKTDPNETPYLVCPGVGGYTLRVRRVEAGRRSIDVVDAENHVFPLDYPASVTPHMASLRPKAEWRVRSSAGRQVPIALIVPVEAREDAKNPDTVTQTYLAIAKIAPNEACVIDKLRESERSAVDARSVADSAQARPCVATQPR